MRTAWFAVGLLALILAFGRPAFAGPAPASCCACTFCGMPPGSTPSFCGDGITTQDACDTFCNSGASCQFHTPVTTACDQVGVCAQAAAAPVGAPAMSAKLQLLLVFALGTIGYATITRRRSSSRS